MKKRPNILLILTDDLGYGDLAINGNTITDTPNIDKLGYDSLRFESFHACPVCAPTRASLLTGRDAMKAGVWHVHGGRDFMNMDETTIAEVYRDNGYKTAMFGKWHSGKTRGYLPYDRGFEESYMSTLYRHKDNLTDHCGKLDVIEGWTTETLTDLATDYIKQNKDEDFFLYVPYLAPHEPWHAPEEIIQKYRDKGCSDGLSRCFAMVDHLDINVGRLLSALEESGIADDTIVIFMSDNGPIGSTTLPDAVLTQEEMLMRNPQHFRGNKGTVYDNGTHVPFFIKWGDKIRTGVTNELAYVADIFPTLLELCGITEYKTTNPIDGISFTRLFKDGEKQDTERLFFNSKHDANWDGKKQEWDVLPDKSILKFEQQDQHQCVRNTQFKLVAHGASYMLYDIINDPCETTDVSNAHPELCERMYNALREWFCDLIKENRCFNIPKFNIGYKAEKNSFVPMYAPAEIGGNVVAGSHASSDWKSANDYQINNIDVMTEGNYSVNLSADIMADDLVIAVTVGDETISANVKKGEKINNIGVLALTEADKKVKIEIKSVTSTDEEVIIFRYPFDGLYFERV